MQAVMERIQKLLNLAVKNSNADEAASAAAKAQELLVRYNLDAATVEKAGGAVDGRREEAKTRGGFYRWQRELWTAVARLNYCLYWTQSYTVEGRFRVRIGDNQRQSRYNRDTGAWEDDPKAKHTSEKTQLQHRIVGRIVNTRSTTTMAQYLEEAIERLAREAIRGDLKQLYSREANSFRYGAMEVVVEKLNQRYRQMERDARAKAAEDARRAAASGASTSTAITMADLRQSEEDANMDHIHGEGYSARRRAQRAEWAREEAEAEAAYAAWAAANPEEAAKKAEEERRAARRYRGGGGTREYETRVDGGAYNRGREAARGISIDRQAGTASTPKIGRST